MWGVWTVEGVPSELSMGWVDPRVWLGWVRLGWEWVDNFYFWWAGLGHGSEMTDLRKTVVVYT